MDSEVVSSFFSNSLEDSTSQDISEDFLNIIDELNLSLEQFSMPKKVEAVYNPTLYARHTFEMYVRKYCNTTKPIMFFGMNPGPWGMSQTGVPFGEISSVRDWLGISGPVQKPTTEVKARPVLGFDCSRTELKDINVKEEEGSEAQALPKKDKLVHTTSYICLHFVALIFQVSGKRFWGLLQTLCGTPENFFKTSFVYNYLPQQWMTASGCNLTPGDFKKGEVQELYNICDPVFSKILELYEVEKIVAIGKFCETRAKETLKRYPSSRSIQILYLPHPSPRAVNNNKWPETATEYLKNHNLLQYYQQD